MLRFSNFIAFGVSMLYKVLPLCRGHLAEITAIELI